MKVKNFNYLQLKLTPDYEGEVEATFISSDSNTHKRPVVLYLHGFIDYFFQPHVSNYLNESGYDFCALELRKYGHSMLPHQHPNYCRNIAEYFEEIDAAILKIREINEEEIIVMGHSTGGLIASVYLNTGNQKSQVSALVLNSPFLDMNIPAIQRIILKPLSKLLGAVSPFLKLDGMLLPIYPSSIHKDNKGEWSFDKELKPIEGFPVYFKWSRAIMDAQDSLKDNSNIQIPILLMHSNDSYIPSKHEARVMTSDIVLNIDHMKKNGPSLGKNVAMVEIQNGMHDLFLSAKPVRELAMETMVKWLKETV
ncbi:MAG: alpha-beta hydrolase superfamily lysophospholipase [Salibacteraceae bacterium]|jgi:alpha-beta hydrolase superfamily lysophospholipase